MAEVWTMGETLVEIMRTEVDRPLNVAAFGPMEGKISPENVQAMRDGTFQF